MSEAELARRTRVTALEPVAHALRVCPEQLAATLKAAGLVALRIEDIQQLGEAADRCTWSRTGRVCPYCRCGAKETGI